MKRTVAIVLILTILVSIFAVVPTAFAKKKKKEKLAKHYYAYTETGKDLNLREKPDIKSKSLLKIPYGDEFYVFEIVNKEWMYGHWGGCFGYVRKRNLKTKKPSAPVKATKKPKTTPKPTKKPSQNDESKKALDKMNAELKSEKVVEPFYVVTRPSRPTGWVNFRVGPGTAATRISTFSDGVELQVIGETKNWYRVTDPETGKVGYIDKAYADEIEKEEEVAAEVEEEGKKRLGYLDVNGDFTLQCDIPQGYDLNVVNIRGDSIIASVVSEDITRPQMYLNIAFNEAYAEVDRMNDLSEEDLAVIEKTFQDMNDVEISYRETGYGTKLLVAREVGSDTDFVSFVSIYKGYFIEFTMTPNPKFADQRLTDEQIKTCIDFLTNLDFVPIESETPAGEIPTIEAPAENASAEEDEAPAEEAPAGETPAEEDEAPAEEAPAA